MNIDKVMTSLEFFSQFSFMKAEDLGHVTLEAPSRFESQDLKIAQDTTPCIQTSSPLDGSWYRIIILVLWSENLRKKLTNLLRK